MNRGNDVCNDKPLTTADRIQLLIDATVVGQHLTAKRVKLAQYQSQDDIYANFPNSIAMSKMAHAPVLVSVLGQGIPLTNGLLLAKNVSCKLTDIGTGADVRLRVVTEKNLEGDLEGSVVDQKNVTRALSINFWWQGLVSIRTSFNRSKLHIITASNQARHATYMNSTIQGIYQTIASVTGYRNFQI